MALRTLKRPNDTLKVSRIADAWRCAMRNGTVTVKCLVTSPRFDVLILSGWHVWLVGADGFAVFTPPRQGRA